MTSRPYENTLTTTAKGLGRKGGKWKSGGWTKRRTEGCLAADHIASRLKMTRRFRWCPHYILQSNILIRVRIWFLHQESDHAII